MIGGLVARHTIIRRRAVVVDDGRGGSERDWSNPDDKELAGWAVDAGATQEDVQNRDGTLIQYTLRGPMNADVQAGDRIVLDGTEYDIDGEPMKQPGPSVFTSHLIVLLKKWRG